MGRCARALAPERLSVCDDINGFIWTVGRKGKEMATNTTASNDVTQQIADIKTHMPNVYRSITDRAEDLGNAVYAMVRRGLRGEANCFYAFEKGRVVGTPFASPSVQDDVAVNMVRFGVAHVVVLADVKGGV